MGQGPWAREVMSELIFRLIRPHYGLSLPALYSWVRHRLVLTGGGKEVEMTDTTARGAGPAARAQPAGGAGRPADFAAARSGVLGPDPQRGRRAAPGAARRAPPAPRPARQRAAGEFRRQPGEQRAGPDRAPADGDGRGRRPPADGAAARAPPGSRSPPPGTAPQTPPPGRRAHALVGRGAGMGSVVRH